MTRFICQSDITYLSIWHVLFYWWSMYFRCIHRSACWFCISSHAILRSELVSRHAGSTGIYVTGSLYVKLSLWQSVSILSKEMSPGRNLLASTVIVMALHRWQRSLISHVQPCPVICWYVGPIFAICKTVTFCNPHCTVPCSLPDNIFVRSCFF